MKTKFTLSTVAFAGAVLFGAPHAVRADTITDWTLKSDALVTEAKIGTPPAIRAMAMVQTAIHDAVSVASNGDPAAAAGVKASAAAAAAHRHMFNKLLPAVTASSDAAYQAALAALPNGAEKDAGIALGEKAAADLLARRADDGAATPEAYRPLAVAGRYAPTVIPAVPQWGDRKPWLMARPSQFRPAPPPALASAAYAQDYNEVKALGRRDSTQRSAEQTQIAKFWEYSLPAIYHGVLRSVALAPGRDVLRNARLFAAAAQAMDDSMISVFEAKYHFQLWRPVTAIRNGALDGNAATDSDASWLSFIEAPMHPEYPSGHGILVGAVGAVIEADAGGAPLPVLATTSPSASGATRQWPSVAALAQEVADARVFGGIHFRTATTVGNQMGQRIGALAARKLIQSADL